MSEVKSLADLMKSNARLKKHTEVARKTAPKFKDFTGEPGELITTFKGMRITLKDGVTYVSLNFGIDGPASGQPNQDKCVVGPFHALKDSDRQTMEQAQEQLFVDIQRMGIDTAELSIGDIDKAVTTAVDKSFKLRAVAGKKDPSRFFFNIIGPIGDAPKSAKPAPVVEDDATDDAAGDEWAEAEDADEPAAEAGNDFNPSDWIGFAVEYKPAKAPKALEFQVVDADDDAGTVVLERDGKKVKAKFADLILPE